MLRDDLLNTLLNYGVQYINASPLEPGGLNIEVVTLKKGLIASCPAIASVIEGISKEEFIAVIESGIINGKMPEMSDLCSYFKKQYKIAEPNNSNITPETKPEIKSKKRNFFIKKIRK